ncbi:hypothetical protein ABH937_003971 [Kitasatospora sp. GAS1066B]
MPEPPPELRPSVNPVRFLVARNELASRPELIVQRPNFLPWFLTGLRSRYYRANGDQLVPAERFHASTIGVDSAAGPLSANGAGGESYQEFVNLKHTGPVKLVGTKEQLLEYLRGNGDVALALGSRYAGHPILAEKNEDELRSGQAEGGKLKRARLHELTDPYLLVPESEQVTEQVTDRQVTDRIGWTVTPFRAIDEKSQYGVFQPLTQTVVHFFRRSSNAALSGAGTLLPLNPTHVPPAKLDQANSAVEKVAGQAGYSKPLPPAGTAVNEAARAARGFAEVNGIPSDPMSKAGKLINGTEEGEAVKDKSSGHLYQIEFALHSPPPAGRGRHEDLVNAKGIAVVRRGEDVVPDERPNAVRLAEISGALEGCLNQVDSQRRRESRPHFWILQKVKGLLGLHREDAEVSISRAAGMRIAIPQSGIPATAATGSAVASTDAAPKDPIALADLSNAASSPEVTPMAPGQFLDDGVSAQRRERATPLSQPEEPATLSQHRPDIEGPGAAPAGPVGGAKKEVLRSISSRPMIPPAGALPARPQRSSSMREPGGREGREKKGAQRHHPSTGFDRPGP